MTALNLVAFGGILVDLVIISIIISNTFWGYRKGLVSVVFKIITFFVSLFVVFVLYKPVSQSIINSTELDEKLAIALEENLTGATIEEGSNDVFTSGETTVSKGMEELIDSFVSEALEQSSSNPARYVSEKLSVFMIQTGTFLLLFILSRGLLLFVRFAAELIANLPIIKMFNKSGGLIYGVLKGFFIVYLLLAVFSLISPIIYEYGVIQAIQDSALGSGMYDNNLILNIFF